MKAFWASVVAAIVIAFIAGVVLNYAVDDDSQDVYQSGQGAVRL